MAAPRPAAVERYSIILNGGPSIRKAGIVPISDDGLYLWLLQRDTGARPDRDGLLPARCRQVAEHHFGLGPRLLGVIGPPHQAQSAAAARRSGPREVASAGTDGFAWRDVR